VSDVFRMIITINTKYFRKQHYRFVLSNELLIINYIMLVIQKVERLMSLLSLLDFDNFFSKVEMGHFRAKPTIFQIWVTTRKFFKSQGLL
jgi:hypothetical protein